MASPSAATTYPDSESFTLDAFTSTWANALSGPPITGMGLSGAKPSSVAYWGGYLWYAPLLNIASYRIDRATGAVTQSSIPKLSRPNGFDSDGSLIWVASRPPGGVWGPLLKYDIAGSLHATVYAPEAGGADAVACESGGFIWVASGQNLYRLDVR